MEIFLPYADFAETGRGSELALLAYGRKICEEWIARSRVDGVMAKLEAEARDGRVPRQDEVAMPWWLGDERVHRSHRSRLVQKDAEWYGPRFPDVADDLDSFWPATTP